MATQWKYKPRNYSYENQKLSIVPQPTKVHPLKESKSSKTPLLTSKQQSISSAKIQKSAVLDPLLGGFDGSDPLSMLTSSNDPLSILALGSTEPVSVKSEEKRNSAKLEDTTEDQFVGFLPWNSIKNGILCKYTTSEKLSIKTSFLVGQGDVSRIKTSTVSDKVKNRLEQLDDFDDGSVKEMLDLSQQDYVKRIDDLNSELKDAWDQDQRVKALKIAIQCSKMLADVTVMQFYPSKFVLITEILETFGQLVYQRILEKSTYTPSGSNRVVKLPDDFTPDQVPESAKETCRNWFYKIASIRELIPRFYVEAAIIKCYKFFKPSEMVETLSRLASMCRGIGHPLVAAYARCYLCRVGMKISPTRKDYIKQSFDDLLLTFTQIQSERTMSVVNSQHISLSKYLTLYSPAIDWILQCIALNSQEQVLADVLDQCQQKANSALLLNGLLNSLSSDYIAKRSILLLDMIRDCEEGGFPKYSLYGALGTKLSTSDPQESDKLRILNEVWKFITKLKEPSEYIHCVEAWMEFVMRNFGKRELSTVLSDVIKHLSPDRTFEEFYPNLMNLLSKILEHVHNFNQLFSMEKFLSFVDLFQKEAVKVASSRAIVEAFIKYQMESISDPVVIGTIMFMCKALHDSVNSLSLDDERRSVSQIICSFIHKVDYGANFEQQLNFYVDSRANFTNLDQVITELVQCVVNLSVTTYKIVKGNHSKKTSAFVRACAAYCFITIPSLQNVFIQLNLYILSGQVALLNRCLSQADALFKAGISALLEAPGSVTVDGKARSTEPQILQFINCFLSLLVVVPDNPDQGVLVLYKGLINVIKSYQFDSGVTARVNLYLSVLRSLCTVSQEKYPYHIERVESNDTLYGHDVKFVTEVESVCSTVLDEILAELKTASEGYDNLKVQAHMSLLSLEHLVCFADLSADNMVVLAKNLWNLSQKYGYADPKQSTQVLSLMKRRALQCSGLSKLVNRISPS